MLIEVHMSICLWRMKNANAQTLMLAAAADGGTLAVESSKKRNFLPNSLRSPIDEHIKGEN